MSVFDHSCYNGYSQVSYVFVKREFFLYANTPDLESFWGIPVKVLGKIENPIPKVSGIWFKYEIDWSKAPGGMKAVPHTNLWTFGFDSSPNLKDATQYKFAVDPSLGIVSGVWSSYWASDRDDIPRWIKGLQQKYSTLPTL